MSGGVDPTIVNLTVFVLAIFVGYHVIWNVTPALHTPLMSLTNAISSIILVGAMLAAGPSELDWGGWLGVLAVFVGYHVVWTVTPALHTPLMSVTNAISSVIIVGAILAAGAEGSSLGSLLGGAAVVLVAINTFGGFLVTERMLEMFKKKDRGEKHQ